MNVLQIVYKLDFGVVVVFNDSLVAFYASVSSSVKCGCQPHRTALKRKCDNKFENLLSVLFKKKK